MDSIALKKETWDKTYGFQYGVPVKTMPQIHDEDYKILDDIFRFYGGGKKPFLRNLPPHSDNPDHPRDIGYQKYYFWAGVDGWGFIRIKDNDDQRRISELKWATIRGERPYHGPSSTLGFTGLEFLNLDCRAITPFPSSIENLTNLKELSLTFCNNFGHLPLDLGKLANLKILKLDELKSSRQPRIEELPQSIVQLSNLEELDLSTGNLRLLPNGIRELSNLRTLCFRAVHSSFSLPEEGLARSFTKLETLSLVNIRRQVTNGILENLADVTSLKHLNLIERGPSSLPDTIGNLAALKILKLQYLSRFKSLPDSIGNLCALTHLDIRCCHSLTSIPDSVGNLANLELLNLSGVNISSLPQTIGELRNLKHLNISKCKNLSSLPNSIGNFIQLRTLNLSMSMVESLPNSIGNLVNLKTLDICATRNLKTLPDEFKNLAGLEVLNLMNAGLVDRTTIPTVIANLKNLQIIILHKVYVNDPVRVNALLEILEACPKLGCIGQHLGKFGCCSCGNTACFYQTHDIHSDSMLGYHRFRSVCHKTLDHNLSDVMYSLVRNKIRSQVFYPCNSSSISFPPLSLWPLILERVENAAKFEVYQRATRCRTARNNCPVCYRYSVHHYSKYAINLYRGGDVSNCLPQADGIFQLLVDHSEKILSHRRGNSKARTQHMNHTNSGMAMVKNATVIRSSRVSGGSPSKVGSLCCWRSSCSS